MKTFLHTLLVCFVFLFFVQCGENDTTPDEANCGGAQQWVDDVRDNFSTWKITSTPGENEVYYENVNTPEDICTDASPYVRFNVLLSDTLPADIISIQGKAYWGLGERRFVSLQKAVATQEYFGSINDLNLKPFFGTSPGWIGLSLIFIVKGQGSESADRQFVESIVSKMEVEFNYHQTK